MNKITAAAGIAFLLSTSQVQALEPGKVLVKVYGVALSSNTDCSNPQVLFYSGTPTEVDFLARPNIGGGNIADGTYPCVIIRMGDIVRFTSATTSGSCTAGAVNSMDVCRAGNGSTDVLNVDGTFGDPVNCNGSSTAPVEDIVTLFLRTTSPGTGNTFRRGTTNGLNLTSAFVVSGSSAGTFVVDGRGKVIGTGDRCDMDAPTFGFR